MDIHKGIYLIIPFLFLITIVSTSFFQSADTSTDGAVKESTRQAMYTGVNKGCLRVDENVVLDEEKTIASFSDKYKNLINFKMGYSNIYVHNIYPYAPSLSTDAYQTLESPVKKYINSYTRSQETNEDSVRAMSIGIFEAKSTIKPSTAEGINDLGNENEVDNFQCR